MYYSLFLLDIEEENDEAFSSYFFFSTEIAFQIVGREIRNDIFSSNVEIASSPFPTLFRVACKIANGGFCRLVMPFMLLDDFFESSSIELCEKMWNVLISLQDEIQVLISKSANTGFSLLNIVNSLLRRTSRVKDGPFRGSVMM